jgi:aminoglycoside 2'-N-acetyltransferase I
VGEAEIAAHRGASLRQLPTAGLTAAELARLRDIFEAAWPDGGFTDDDFAHGMGGMHWVAEVDGTIVSHASVVERRLEAGDVGLRTGYLEAVATQPAFERRGFGSMVVRAAAAYLRPRFQIGALSTSEPGFYTRLGWEAWSGPTWVRTRAGELQRTEDDDGGIFILRTPTTPRLTLTAPLVCDWRSGDVW